MIIFHNTSKKIISVNSIAVMPGDSTEIPDSYADLPSIKALAETGKAIVTPKVEPKPVKKPAAMPVEPEAVSEEVHEEIPVEAPEAEPAKPKRRSKDSKAVEEALAKEIFG